MLLLGISGNGRNHDIDQWMSCPRSFLIIIASHYHLDTERFLPCLINDAHARMLCLDSCWWGCTV